MAKLSIFDPISGGYVNLDGGNSSMLAIQYSILVELRVQSVLLQQLAAASTDDVANIRADQSVAEPLFTQTR